jgi:hypothetical protein
MEPETPGSIVAAKVTAQAIGTGVGLMLGGALGSVLGSAVGPVLETIFRRGDRQMAGNVFRVLNEAGELADLSPGEMSEMIDGDDRYLAISPPPFKRR